ncbi:MAG: M60 family metallopeptidase [Puniceicoccales bacterium]|nr:M60 family metallopeptidase [Puniceicoccales bacterium]
MKKRNRIYEAYETTPALAARMKTNQYSKYENPTGIYFEKGDVAIVNVVGMGEDKAVFKVEDFGPDKTGRKEYPLTNGMNVFPVKKGLAYISYYTDNFANAPKLRVHVLSGKVNGVFDPYSQTNEDWQNLLAQAPCEMIDLQGKHVHLVYHVDGLKKYCPDDGVQLMKLYDQIIGYQFEIMGLFKYNKVPKNRMFGRNVWGGYMHADGTGAAFNSNVIRKVARISDVRDVSWPISHEFGHVNQVRPGMKWVSTTETTNNIFSVWANYKLSSTGYNVLEDENKIDEDGQKVIGGRFNAYLDSALIKKEQWLCQRGSEGFANYPNGSGDHFVKLYPFWQLMLYFKVAGRGNPDFYPDIFEIVRNTNDEGKKQGDFQLAFMKNACDVTRQDLTEFFVTIGMLKPIDKMMKDYKSDQLTITQEECDALIKYAKKYKKPESPVIYYLSSKSVDAYAKRLPVAGKWGAGISQNGNTFQVSHAVWKNVAAFETYEGDKLVKISKVGTGSKDNTFTQVKYPEGATRIEAVSWNGARTLVYGKR